ncbi:hypothetical protein [Bacillus sp. ISL-37]|uniref:hypothetical protein n=1 Tax=Bacillus sp. ISL-37 TaxID=2819123 RepID=UPI001BE72BEF|nr:hypothetical protein [Bacillus sp. ISL-37]MBT2684179.1 hypothetical protein [Bacillus sp. ISL-37]
MNSIKINPGHIKITNQGLARQIYALDNLTRNLMTLKNSVDPKIKSRQQIASRLARSIEKGNKIELHLSQLERFIDNSIEKYSATERKINSHHLKDPGAKDVGGKDNKQKKQMDESIFDFLDELGNSAVLAQSAIAALFVLSKQINIDEKRGHPGRAVIHTAKWIKGKGNIELLNKLARRMDKSIRNPGLFMKGLKTADGLLEKVTRTQLIGLSKAKSFPHFMKTVITGIDDGVHGIETSKIPRMIAKRVYAVDAVFSTAEEGIGLYREHKKGTLDGKDVAVAASNVIIKSGATAAGAIIGGTLGMALGPGGAAVGAFLGGSAGVWLGDATAKFTESIIRDGPIETLKDTGSSIKKGLGKGFNWAKDLFK